jgi:hypothetical protein
MHPAGHLVLSRRRGERCIAAQGGVIRLKIEVKIFRTIATSLWKESRLVLVQIMECAVSMELRSIASRLFEWLELIWERDEVE